jgi:hypothetical protein
LSRRATSIPTIVGTAYPDEFVRRSALNGGEKLKIIPQDDSFLERALRCVAIGRKNYLFAGCRLRCLHKPAGSSAAFVASRSAIWRLIIGGGKETRPCRLRSAATF